LLPETPVARQLGQVYLTLHQPTKPLQLLELFSRVIPMPLAQGVGYLPVQYAHSYSINGNYETAFDFQQFGNEVLAVRAMDSKQPDNQ
jgi:hypothetical protein